MAEPLTLGDFTPHVGADFAVLGPADPVALRLVAADALPADPAGRSRAPFSLEFVGPVDPAFAQATLTLEHPALGPLDIFVVPLARDAAGTRYQAVFA